MAWSRMGHTGRPSDPNGRSEPGSCDGVTRCGTTSGGHAGACLVETGEAVDRPVAASGPVFQWQGSGKLLSFLGGDEFESRRHLLLFD